LALALAAELLSVQVESGLAATEWELVLAAAAESDSSESPEAVLL